MRIQRKWIVKISAALVLLITLMSFQNCGQINVAALPPPPPLNLASKSLPRGSYCSQTGSRFGAQVRFVFVMDMSISNLGNAAPDCNPDFIDLDGRCPWKLAMNMAPTDKPGMRFNIVDGSQGFIAKCGTQVDFQYSVMGFSSDKVFGNIADSCVSPFKTAQNVKQNVQALRDLQNSDSAKDGTFSPPYQSPFQMGETFYSKAISCLQQKIEYDAGNTADSPLYQVFFLTDGRPTDSLTGGACAGLTNEQCIETIYKPSLQSLRDYTRSKAGNLKFQPIYYGNETGAARDSAKQALNGMAEAANGEEDPSIPPSQKTQTLEISDFTTLTDQLCSAYKPQAQVAYEQQYAWAVNLSSVYENGKQEPDSDMDGIPDKDDPNPLNPRSSGGVLDKLCRLKNGNTPCVKPSVGCDLEFIGLGLNRCDVEVAQQIYGKTLTGFDTDGDGLPDFLEIRMGLNPTIPDLGPADLDGDGISNEQEIRWGLNPELVNKNVPDKDKLRMSTVQVAQPGCDSGLKYQFTFDQIPLAENLAYTGKIGNLDTTLQAGENQIMLISIQQPIGQQNLKKKMTIQLLKSNQTGEPVVGPVQVLGDY